MSNLLTPKQLAEHYQTSNKTVLEWYHKGLIPAEVATGSVYRFDLEKVKKALAPKEKDTKKATKRPMDRARGGAR